MVNGIKLIQIGKSKITLSYLMYVNAYSLIIISRLLESVCLCPKVIPYHIVALREPVAIKSLVF